ncbi:MULTISPECIES: LysR family transcriptional regulator [Brevibacillus]|uniref:HTH-type transcriptional regulator CzcR n=1 Tax=Brevibacillus parabrevis TaxID=54914 RepID=A0A4Y3PHU7_BREPA|nr:MULTISPECIES: LysR family transcriptional regulator [Brevibacillus]MDR5001831.1 LysR family transcriptional regulator [Brevibacillus parabrevis]RNB95101.1 LysR family transcriptional regulator [Brevibacillus parabrevis]UED68027.1 LysR family transcriptional regulator [Brevibacillus sp. HD3.3A]GEB34072.1 HTH-type transcriptional regulator CzcR [Brevibacillus parabrevis]
MELNDLKIFHMVATLGSVSKAAAELSYVQSNVTARIKLLEKELGTPLFYRHKRGMTLNTEGRRLLEYSRDILTKLDDMHRFFHQSSEPSGVLSIGMVETINRLPELLSAYCSRFPQVDLSLTAGVTEHLLRMVLDVELDGAFVTGPISHPLIEQMQVFSEELVLVSKGSSFTMDDMPGKALLLYNKGCGFRERLEGWMKLEGVIPRKVMEFGTYETIIGGVTAGIGMTILPKSAVRQLAESGQIHMHPVPKPYRDVTTMFIRRKDAAMTSTLQSFLAEIGRHSG